jgi:hypothetical protein
VSIDVLVTVAAPLGSARVSLSSASRRLCVFGHPIARRSAAMKMTIIMSEIR